MITINLLSPTQKKRIRTKKIHLAITEAVLVILLFTSITAILFVASKYYLEEQLTHLIARNSTQIKASQEINTDIIAINKKINNVYNIQDNFIKWSNFFAQLSSNIPNNIKLNFLKIYRQDGTLEISGVAKTRTDLLNLKQTLEDWELLDEIHLPLSDLLAKEKNTFSIKAKINLDRI